ncbi:MAG TPA: D-alanyl-D-alanine carboxypeptidase/D-alanyl-D-alanine-endopeptidase [Pyrinomonadaceae bacterium]|nr:D-alanyl-D-alanine carboxypeptidase/D-alanyl-D-alanine-endopeptidase [Pyrinomonadaceae bacterium]
MSKSSRQSRTAVFIISAIVFLGINFGTSAQEDSKRNRVIVGATPTPKPTATPKTTPTPISAPSPKPTATPLPTPIPQTIQTLESLQTKIRLVLSRPELRRGTVAVKIASLNSGKVLFEDSAEKYVMPASNMKSFTVATAMEKLTPNFRFVTSVFANAMPDETGTIKGDLTIFGRGDISFSTAFYEGDYYKGLDALADKIVQSGVKKVEGNLIGDESYFSGSAIPSGWEWDDLQWYYGAEVSALPLNDNALDLSVKPASSAGSLCLVQLQPLNSVYRVANNCRTVSANGKRDLNVKKDLDQNVLEVYGTLPVGDKGFSNYLTVSHPSELFVSLLKQRLQQKGVTITGQTRTIGTKEKSLMTATSTVAPVEITKLESFPFSLIAAKTMKPSQNLYTETILWTLGEEMNKNAAPNNSISADKGLTVVKNFLQQIGIPEGGIVQYDGSGLSRHNLVTADALVRLYTYMGKQSRFSMDWRNSLTIAGVDGTLKNRFVGTSGAGNVRGKTGTIDQVSALSGYVTTAAGEQLVFSVIVNGVPNSRTRTATIDEIVLNLVNFNGKVD